MTKVLNWGMTPGMGDVMMALNCAYHWSYEYKTNLILNLHWFHNKEYLHHCEETETIIERTDYIKDLYLLANVKINHIFNSDQIKFKPVPKKIGLRYDWFKPRKAKTTNDWSFNPSAYLPVDKKKVVLWRPLYNAEVPRLWKRTVINDDWDLIIYNLREMGYNIVELCYRTPIREVTYHINTCNFVVCYDGMWHYIAKNFWKPMIISSTDPITDYHTTHSVFLKKDKFTSWVSNIHHPIYNKNRNEYISPYDLMHRRANIQQTEFWEAYNANR